MTKTTTEIFTMNHVIDQRRPGSRFTDVYFCIGGCKKNAFLGGIRFWAAVPRVTNRRNRRAVIFWQFEVNANAAYFLVTSFHQSTDSKFGQTSVHEEYLRMYFIDVNVPTRIACLKV